MQAWGHLLQDDPQAARAALPHAPTGGALDASLRVHLGLAPNPIESPAAATRAAWLTGDLDVLDRVQHDPKAPARVRIVAHDHLALLSAEPRPLPRAQAQPAPITGPTSPRVVHV
ncbi:MAG: hypothetical protein Q4F67_16255, partial [Propionibacteriaceae bacterium]|nr:hypothetical protein [Propionibacteriaceae bacterium]